MKHLFTVALSTVFLLAVAGDAFACSCASRPTVLEAFEGSSLVVATRLTSVDKTREKEGKYDISHISSATMIVTKVYKGDVKPGAELKFRQGGGADCVWTFEEEWIDEEFLFYLGEPTRGHPWGGAGRKMANRCIVPLLAGDRTLWKPQ